MNAPAAVSVHEVSKSFGDFRALSGVSLAIRTGEIHALIGPNGAGKSTLLNVIAGQFPPSAGEVRHQGQRISGRPAHEVVRRGVARSFQITSIFPGFSVFANVQLALLARRGWCTRMLRSADRLMQEETLGLLRLVRLDPHVQRVAGELAAGDRKRLEFAISLAGAPDVLLLDEPTAGMSPGERAIVTELLQGINVQRGVTVLFTEHDIDMVFAIAHRVTVLHQGACIASGSPQEVRADPRVQEVYLGEGVDHAAVH